MKTLPLGPFLGINTRLPDFALHVADKGDFLRAADNVLIDNAGTIKLRPADRLVQSMAGAHSWHASTAVSGYLVRGGVMYSVDLQAGYSETLFKVLSNDSPVSWLILSGDIYWSNGTDSGRIRSGVNYPLGLPTPDAPSVGATAGTLSPGWYQVALSYSNTMTGEEGGVSASTNVELAAGGGLSISIPSVSAGATTVNIYVSATNGGVLTHHASVTGSGNVIVSAPVVTGREANQRFEKPIPAGSGLFEANGRLCSIVGSRVYIGLPWRHGYYIPTEGYLDFPAAVSLGVSCQSGTFIAADKTYFFPGDLGDVQDQVRDALPYGAVPGTAFQYPDKSLVGWFGAQGIVLASPDGQVNTVMSDNLKLIPPANGYSALLLSDELRKVVSCGWCLNLNTLAATTYSDFNYTSTSGGYGTKADGFYRLEATGSVAWSIDLGKINFGVENEKYLPAVYAGYASDDLAILTVTLPDGSSYDYDARSCSDNLDVHRFDTGMGLRANWFGLSMSRTNTTFILASVSFAPAVSTRRI